MAFNEVENKPTHVQGHSVENQAAHRFTSEANDAARQQFLQTKKVGPDNVAQGGTARDNVAAGPDNVAQGGIAKDNVAVGPDNIAKGGKGKDNYAGSDTAIHKGKDNVGGSETGVTKGKDNVAGSDTTIHKGKGNVGGSDTTIHKGKDNVAGSDTTIPKGSGKAHGGSGAIEQGVPNEAASGGSGESTIGKGKTKHNEYDQQDELYKSKKLMQDKNIPNHASLPEARMHGGAIHFMSSEARE